MMNEKAKAIFISRSLEDDSPFWALKQQGHTIIAQSLIAFKSIEFELPPAFDAVFFYSQKAIAPFLKKAPFDKTIQYGVMGLGSKNHFFKLSGQYPQLVATPDHLQTSESINKLWAGKRLIIPCATQSLKALGPALSISHTHIPVYENKPRTDVKIPYCDICLLTSPMNAEVFLSNKNNKYENIYAIGATTAKTIKKLTGTTVLYCKEPSVDNLYLLTLTKL